MVEALLGGLPDHREVDKALAFFGLYREVQAPAPEVLVWPEHWDALHLFMRLLTQWRYGPAGRTGLDYTAALALMWRVPLRRRDRLLDELRAMEVVALEWWARQRQRNA